MRLFSICLFAATCTAFSTPVHAWGTTRLKANIAIFGGSGKTGSECVYQALKQGSKPFVMARDPSKLKVPLGSGGKLGGTPLYDSNVKVRQSPARRGGIVGANLYVGIDHRGRCHRCECCG